MPSADLFKIAIDPFYKIVSLNFGKDQADRLLKTKDQPKIIFDSFYKAVSLGLGEKMALDLANKTLDFVKKNYGYEQVGDYLQQLPDYLFDNDRITYLSRKALEELVAQRTKELIKLKDEFFFMAAHDLRNPVTAIAWTIEIMKRGAETLPAEMRENILAITECADRLKLLINDLLQIARSESGTMDITLSAVNAGAVIAKAAEEIASTAKQKNVTVDVSGVPDGLMASANEARLTEVMENLLSNAVKYNKNKGWIKIVANALEGMVKITVADGGYGIPENQQEKVFRKFFRAQSESTKNVAGTGLGLAITKMLVEKMQGRIDFHSEENQGTTFTVWLKPPQ